MSKFGSPDHDSIWFEDKSLRHPNGAHFDNLRNEIKSWREHVLSSGTYPCFTSWTDSEEDIGSMIEVSDLESEAQDEADDVQNYYTNNKSRMETLWKLYRNIGETIEDMKIRLTQPSLKNKSFTCSEHNNSQNKYIKTESESSDCEKENESTDSTITVEQEPDEILIKSESEKSEYHDNDLSNSNTFDDVLDIQLRESNENIQLSDIHDDIDTQDWPSESSIHRHNSRNSESRVDPTPNCTYDVPRLKQITKEELIFEKKTTSRKKRTAVVDVKKEESAGGSGKKSREPIIVDMYGIRTISYNESPPKVKIPDCFKTSRLSDSSCDEEIELVEEKRHSSILKNRFRNNKRKRSDDNDFLLAYAVNLSGESDAAEASLIKKIRGEENSKDFDRLSEEDLEEQLEIVNNTTSTTTSSSSSSCTCTRSSCSCSASVSSSEVEN
ncbi:hypothetical protein TSAR_010506 [Trichomalopsis sarcophagae]|uniref:Uncharacterized protein n=1 Tax=Trichomalopsis sarcophagae TaxID=543379 RepID=A0A232FJU4_9HYME|nr:hypothetical protein TSAR_010506 [Trichomalopsis sarcophagae]